MKLFHSAKDGGTESSQEFSSTLMTEHPNAVAPYSKPVLLSLHGLPRSGKSTLTSKLRVYYGAPVVNADAVRLALHGQRYEALAEPFVFAIRQVMVRALFGAGHPMVIYDETNYSRAARDRMRSADWDCYYIELDTPPDECKERAIATGQPDLLPVIDSMWARREPLEADELRWIVPDAITTPVEWRSAQ